MSTAGSRVPGEDTVSSESPRRHSVKWRRREHGEFRDKHGAPVPAGANEPGVIHDVVGMEVADEEGADISRLVSGLEQAVEWSSTAIEPEDLIARIDDMTRRWPCQGRLRGSGAKQNTRHRCSLPVPDFPGAGAGSPSKVSVHRP